MTWRHTYPNISTDDEDFEPGDLTEEKGDTWEGEDEEEIKVYYF